MTGVFPGVCARSQTAGGSASVSAEQKLVTVGLSHRLSSVLALSFQLIWNITSSANMNSVPFALQLNETSGVQPVNITRVAVPSASSAEAAANRQFDIYFTCPTLPYVFKGYASLLLKLTLNDTSLASTSSSSSSSTSVHTLSYSLPYLTPSSSPSSSSVSSVSSPSASSPSVFHPLSTATATLTLDSNNFLYYSPNECVSPGLFFHPTLACVSCPTGALCPGGSTLLDIVIAALLFSYLLLLL
jgi:hypothetical protein